VRGHLDSRSYLACYVNGGRIDAAVGLNRAKDVRRIMPLIKSRRAVDLDQGRSGSLLALRASTAFQNGYRTRLSEGDRDSRGD
jgi:hypothetical protein